MKQKLLVPVTLAAAVFALVLIAPAACPYPDGLEKIAGQCGFSFREKTVIGGLMPGYEIPGVKNAAVARIIAGAAGAAAVFVVVACVGLLAGRRNAKKGNNAPFIL